MVTATQGRLASMEMTAGAKALLLALVFVGGCQGGAGESKIKVFAASVFTDVTAELASSYTSDGQGPAVEWGTGGSQVLRYQIEQGAPVDVFMSGHIQHIEILERAGLIEKSRVFARGELVLIVPIDNPAGIESFDDLASARRIVLGEPNSPVGRYTRELLDNTRRVRGEKFVAAIESKVVSRESNARLVRAKVGLGEADAAIVYRSDAVSSDRIRMIRIPEELAVPIDFHVGAISLSRNEEAALAWIDMLTSPVGGEVLERHGFGALK